MITPPRKRALFALGIIVLIIPLTIYLVSKTQIFNPRAASITNNAPDLDVTYISRTPRYYKYCVSYPNGLPTLCPGTENRKMWPDVGETVTYTAHVINKGTIVATPTTYQWIVDGQTVNTGSIEALQPNQEITFTLQNAFPASAQSIKFTVDPSNTLTEVTKVNNALTIGSHELTVSWWVERQYYDAYNQHLNLVGSFSFEDWMQAEIAKMNERFSQAKYLGLSPNGIRDRIRIDKVVVEDDTDGPTSQFRNDPDEFLVDGRWVSSDGDPTNEKGQNGLVQESVSNFINTTDWGAMHEITHQMGIIDLYRMNIKNNEPASPNGGVFVTDINGQNAYQSLNFPVFSVGGLMGGGEISPYTDGTYYDVGTAGALNSNFQKRRGFFGEYLFDTPTNNTIRVVDKNGSALANAAIALYQKDYDTEDIDNTPEITGTTDANGFMHLPNKTVPSFTTVTGHTLHDNPFGKINVTGQNGTMILTIIKDNAEGFGFYRLYDINVAYYSGETSNSTVTIKTNYPKVFSNGTTPFPTPTSAPTPTSIITPTNIPNTTPSPTPANQANICSTNLTDGQVVSGSSIQTQLTGTKDATAFLSLWALSTKLGIDFQLGANQGNTFTTTWNASVLYNDGPATLECRIQTTATGGTTLFARQYHICINNTGSANCQSTNPTPTSIATTTPFPSRGVTPTVFATPTSGPTSIPQATATPQPTPTFVPGGTQLAFSLVLQGIGSGATTTPLHPQRSLNIQLFDQTNQKIKDITSPITFSPATGKFTGTFDVGTVSAGDYTIKVKSDRYLRKQFPGIQKLTTGTNTLSSSLTLIVGDINGDNKLDILDYNLLRDCGYGAITPLPMSDPNSLFNKPACSQHTERENVDLDDNGIINSIDYNFFIRNLGTQNGD